ncbi:NACHT domain-containing protein [Bisporella sp. PMI_857]|nr:NACHT domain-containing protein [Bisporella sp. PMI_857]
MCLLEVLPNEGFRLIQKLLGDAIPPYAILSYTWGSEEVTFEDMVANSGRTKAGYEKIKFCGKQAKRDGLQHFWVDSCCIKKSSDAEISECSTPCFARDEEPQDTWGQAFRQSKWFTRGWTLQELLAPRSVEFFTREGKRLGDKHSLEQQIHEITGIPVPALRGSALSQVSTVEKFHWAKGRQTTREEDWAYSLLGIFEIFMPVIYGEGKTNAVRRLRKEIDDFSKVKDCLRDLYVTDPRTDKIRIEKTKGGLLLDSYHWILENGDFKQWRSGQQDQVLWIKGDPGKGKTMLLCGIIDELKRSVAETHQLSYFFCKAADSRLNNTTAVLRGLLYLLIDQQPSLVSHIKQRHNLAGKPLFENANSWASLCDIFADILQDLSLKSTFLIIDALGECTGDLPKLLVVVCKIEVSKPVGATNQYWAFQSLGSSTLTRPSD